MKDLISREAAIDAIRALPPEPQDERIFQEIVVEYPSYSTYTEYIGKPYFSIKYTENGQGFIGYGTYKPEVLSEYLKEYFMPPEHPKTGHWVQDDIASNIFRCSECGCDAPVDPTAGCEIKSNFCYVCGADMRGVK